MSIITKRKLNKRTLKRTLNKQEKLDRLLIDIEAARKELKKGKAIKGDVEDIMKGIREYKDEDSDK
ncbi:MAG TPA: hypothetical protein VJ455_12790 [Ignavibacteria bacterium]|nr:hypothetical protein [Ignavibacteria bacterium]